MQSQTGGSAAISTPYQWNTAAASYQRRSDYILGVGVICSQGNPRYTKYCIYMYKDDALIGRDVIKQKVIICYNRLKLKDVRGKTSNVHLTHSIYNIFMSYKLIVLKMLMYFILFVFLQISEYILILTHVLIHVSSVFFILHVVNYI